MRLRLYIIVALFILTIVVGTIGVSIIEGWDFVDSFYWAITTVTTVGYGDQPLFRPESRAFAAVFVVLSFMVVGATLGQVGAVLVDLEVLSDRPQYWKPSRRCAHSRSYFSLRFDSVGAGSEELCGCSAAVLLFLSAVSLLHLFGRSATSFYCFSSCRE